MVALNNNLRNEPRPGSRACGEVFTFRVRKTISNGGVAGTALNGATDYPGAAAHTGMGQSGFRAAGDTGFPDPRPDPLNIYGKSSWQCMEERNPFGGGGSTDTPTKQYIWGQYPDASGLPRESGMGFQLAENGRRVSIDECLQLNLLAVAGPQALPIGAYYLLQDLLYRAVALANASGQIVEAYDCDPYGNTLIFTAPGPDGLWFTDGDVQSSYGANEIIYCGYSYDAEAQLYYVRNRTYSPVLGTWIQRDPIGYQGGINLYGYVESNPVDAVDPPIGANLILPFFDFLSARRGPRGLRANF